jgi:hypothetical protein
LNSGRSLSLIVLVSRGIGGYHPGSERGNDSS